MIVVRLVLGGSMISVAPRGRLSHLPPTSLNDRIPDAEAAEDFGVSILGAFQTCAVLPEF